MRHRVRICGSVALIGALAVSPAAAQDATPPNAQGDVAVTIYNNGQSLVQDERQLAVKAGRNRIEFPDVSARIRPETVTLSGAGLAIVEQTFDLELLTPDKLMDKAAGKTTTPDRPHPPTGPQKT